MSINFQKYESDIVAKAKTYKVPGSDWEDVAQELRIHIWKKRDKFDASRGVKERTFVMSMLMNKIRDLRKYSNSQKRHLDTYHLTFSQVESFEFGDQLLEKAVPLNLMGLIINYEIPKRRQIL